MSDTLLESAFGGGSPVRLLAPYDVRFVHVFKCVMDTINGSAEAVSETQRTVRITPHEDGTLAVFYVYPDGGSVGMVIPAAYWKKPSW
jgi:hypothetical protein